MSQSTKEHAGDAKRFFKEVSEEARRFQQAIPDKQLGEKLRKVSESASEIVKHIEEHSK